MKKNSLFDNWFVYNYQRLRNIIRTLPARGRLSRRLFGDETGSRDFGNTCRELRALFFRRVQKVQTEMYSQG